MYGSWRSSYRSNVCNSEESSQSENDASSRLITPTSNGSYGLGNVAQAMIFSHGDTLCLI
ncbi:hypothetical protein THOB06_150106 [Vibrio rotiferianus]|nr:hypothetical protein THOG10_150106 [Vibrio rotiferianus]CAH1566826.1 hypothetical protein THOB06_150106 [Vibrio rotiferianus]